MRGKVVRFDELQRGSLRVKDFRSWAGEDHPRAAIEADARRIRWRGPPLKAERDPKDVFRKLEWNRESPPLASKWRLEGGLIILREDGESIWFAY